MTPADLTTKLRDLLTGSGLFDAEWYAAAYSDVAASGMDPLDHFLALGMALGRSPGPEHNETFLRQATIGMADSEGGVLGARLRGRPVAVRANRVMLAAARLAEAGQVDEALRLSRLHLEPQDRPARLVLRANEALRQGDRAGWLRALNAYLAPFDLAPITLGPGAGLLDRLDTAPVGPVQDDQKISVLLAAWNAERTIEAAVRSILRQSWRNLELLVVDDASTDGTWRILRRLAARDGRIRPIRNDRNVGPYASKNRALALADGAWITGQDGDDWSHPQRLERQVRAMRATGGAARAGGGLMLRMSEAGHFGGFGLRGPNSPDGVMRRALISCLFEAGLMRETLGAWDSVRFGADAEMIWRAETVLGEGYRDMPIFTMLCLHLPGSLTAGDTGAAAGATGGDEGTDESADEDDGEPAPANGQGDDAPAAGPAARGGLSPVRAAYFDAFRGWHERARAGGHSLKMDFPLAVRPFDAPPEMVVPVEDVMQNLARAPLPGSFETPETDP